MPKLVLLVAALPLFACSGEVVAPERLGVPSLAASSSWTHGSLLLDFTFGDVNSCVGEELRGVGEVPYRMHEVLTDNGQYSYFFQLRPVTPWGPQYSLTGVSTGRVWWYQHGLPSNESFHLGRGGVHHFKAHETYESEDGERLFFERTWHLTVNANGQLVVSRIEGFGPDAGLRCGRRNEPGSTGAA